MEALPLFACQGLKDRHEPAGLLGHLMEIRDPRIERTKKHLLVDILAIAICAVICGAEGWGDIEEFGLCHEERLGTFLELPFGIPSHDTFARVLSILNPEAFEKCFMAWTQALHELSDGRVIAIDGKTLRGSFDKATGKGAIHLVSAWAVENQVVLGQVKVDEKSNEITAVPKLLALLNLRGAIVSMDAMGCQKDHARQIFRGGGDYLFSLKGNQGTLHEEIRMFLEDSRKDSFRDVRHGFFETTEKGHGRIEIRRYWQTDQLDGLESCEGWVGIKTVGMVEATRIIGETSTTEVRYFLSSLPNEAEKFAQAVRGHWGTENGQHWCLDVGMGEDACRIRMRDAAENFGVLRRIALNLLKKEKTTKRGIRAKAKKAGWDRNYLIRVLLGPQSE
jgi:predicted transposase YbfD/YdcC